MPDDTGSSRNPQEFPAGSGSQSPEALLRAIMQRQGRLSIGVAAVFLVLVLGLPLLNAFFPEIAQTRIGGFSATWLFLGVLFYPITWFLSAYFVRKSEEVE